MSLVLNLVYGIVYRLNTGITTVFNGRVVRKTNTTTTIRFMNSRGVVIRRTLNNRQIVRAVQI